MRQTQEEIQGLRFPSDGRDEKEPAKETKKEEREGNSEVCGILEA